MSGLLCMDSALCPNCCLRYSSAGFGASAQVGLAKQLLDRNEKGLPIHKVPVA